MPKILILKFLERQIRIFLIPSEFQHDFSTLLKDTITHQSMSIQGSAISAVLTESSLAFPWMKMNKIFLKSR